MRAAQLFPAPEGNPERPQGSEEKEGAAFSWGRHAAIIMPGPGKPHLNPGYNMVPSPGLHGAGNSAKFKWTDALPVSGIDQILAQTSTDTDGVAYLLFQVVDPVEMLLAELRSALPAGAE